MNQYLQVICNGTDSVPESEDTAIDKATCSHGAYRQVPGEGKWSILEEISAWTDGETTCGRGKDIN